MKRKLVKRHEASGRLWQEESLSRGLEIETLFLYCPSPNLVNISTELPVPSK